VNGYENKKLVEFGLFESKNNEAPTYWKVNREDGYNLDDDSCNCWWIYSTFNLVCHHTQTYKMLITHIKKWIDKLPCNKTGTKSIKDVRSAIWNEVNNSLKSNLRL
jgi:hypothetical protein